MSIPMLGWTQLGLAAALCAGAGSSAPGTGGEGTPATTNEAAPREEGGEWTEKVAVTAEIEGADDDPLGTTSTLLDPRRGVGTPSTVSDLAVAVPGVSQNGQGGLFQVVSIRGVSRHRVLNLVSDMRIFSDRRAGATVSFVDPNLIGSIDVLRGAATTFHGSGALGGVVRVAPRRFEGWTALAGYDSRGDENYETVGYGEGNWSFGLSRRDARNSRAPDGTELDSHFTQYSGVLRFDREGERYRWQLLYVPSAADDVGKPNTDFPVRTTTYPRERHHLIELATHAERGWEARAWVHAQELETRVVEPDLLSRVENSSVDWGARWQREQSAGGIAGITWGFDAVGRAGVDARESQQDADPTTDDIPVTSRPLDGASQLEAGAFASADWTWSRTRLETGARLSWQGQDNGGAGRTDERALNGFVGLTRTLVDRLELRANVSSGLRFPTLSELFFSGTTGRGEVLGNPDLDPERALGADLALRWVGNSVLLHAGVFRTGIDDYIERVETAPDVLTWTNLVSGTIEGVELQAMLLPSPRWLITAGGHTMRGRADDDTPLEDIPPDEVWAGGTHRAGPWTIDARWRHRLDKDDPGSGEKPIGSADLLDLKVQRAVGDAWTVSLVGSNLLDELYFPSADRQAVPAAERSFGLHVAWKLP